MGTFDAMPQKKTLEHTSSLVFFSTFRKKGSFYFCTNFMKMQTTNHEHLIKHNLKTKLLCTWFSLALWVRTFYIGHWVEYNLQFFAVFISRTIANIRALLSEWTPKHTKTRIRSSQCKGKHWAIQADCSSWRQQGFQKKSIVLHHHSLM